MKTNKISEVLKRAEVGKILLGLLLFIELFLAVPYEAIIILPVLNKWVYILQIVAAVGEIAYLIYRLFVIPGKLWSRLKLLLREYSIVAFTLFLFVAYNWIVTFVRKSMLLIQSTHYIVQVLILTLSAARTFRSCGGKTVFSIAALYFWTAIMANSIVFIMIPKGLYISDSEYGIHHACYLFGLDNQFGKIYFAGFALTWFYEEKYKKTYFMTLSSLLMILYVYFQWKNGTGMVVSAVLIALMLLYNIKQLRWSLSMTLFVVVAAYISISIIVQDSFIYSGGALVDRVTEFTSKSGTFSGRFSIWAAAVEKISENVLVGYGRVPENVHLYVNGWYRNAHNEVLQILLDGGAIGLGFFTGSFVVMDIKCIKQLRKKPELRILFIGIFTSLLYFMAEVGTMLPMFLCLVLACLYAGEQDQVEASADDN